MHRPDSASADGWQGSGDAMVEHAGMGGSGGHLGSVLDASVASGGQGGDSRGSGGTATDNGGADAASSEDTNAGVPDAAMGGATGAAGANDASDGVIGETGADVAGGATGTGDADASSDRADTVDSMAQDAGSADAPRVLDASSGEAATVDAGCSAGFQECTKGVCIDTRYDPQNCGQCGRVCEAPASGVAICSGGSCGGACIPGATACGAGVNGGGACYDLTSDVHHCGTCDATTCDECLSSTCHRYKFYGNYDSFLSTGGALPGYLLGWKIDVGSAGTLRKVGIIAGNLSVSVVAQVGVYADTGTDYPGALLTSATQLLLDGRNEITVPAVELSSGGYWLMVAYDHYAEIMASTTAAQTVTVYFITFVEGTTLLSAFPSQSSSMFNFPVNYYLVVE